MIWIVSRSRIKQFNVFNCLSNVKNFVFSIGSEHMLNAIQWHLKWLAFQQLSRVGASPQASRPPAAGGKAPRPASVMSLSYTSSLTHVSRFRYFHLLILVHTQTTASGLQFYDIFVPQKVPFSKICNDVIANNLWFGSPPIKNRGNANAVCTMQLVTFSTLN